MFEQRFCNYQRNDQQRLGFLKVVSWTGEGLRGGPEEIRARMIEISQGSPRQRAVGRNYHLDVDSLLRRPEVPSWLPGFVPKLYSRAVVWAQSVGIIAPTGRLSEWANVLNSLAPQRNLRDFNISNPFILSTAERIFFVHLLFYHDQVLPGLVDLLGRLPPGTRIGLPEACRLVSQAMAEFLDRLHMEGPAGLKMRLALRDNLKKIARESALLDPHALINPKTRPAAIEALGNKSRPTSRVLTAERQAVCRMEQLTDLGFMNKEDPASPPASTEDVDAARTTWAWYTMGHLPSAADELRGKTIEQFLRQSWIKFSTASFPPSAFHTAVDQAELTTYMDRALPVVRRQIGPVQVHPWAMLTCLLAAENGVIIEVDDVHTLLSDLHANPETNKLVGLGGTDSFRGRNVVVPGEGLSSVLSGIGKV